MGGIEYDTSQAGFLAVLKDWQLKAMQVVWNSPEGANSRTVWMETNTALKTNTISRASIINFLEAMREMGAISRVEVTGKCGHCWVYYSRSDEEGFKKLVVEEMIAGQMESFPDETRAVLISINSMT